jgi:hypothetical protein
VGKLPGDVTENVFDARTVPPGKLPPATSMRAIVNVAVPAARGQYWIEMRLIPIFTYGGTGGRTFRACMDVSIELWQHPVRPWNHGRYGVTVGVGDEDTGDADLD